MEITDRQKGILNTLVEEYISSAEPVSSKELQKKRDFGVSPATIRNEMQRLMDAGFISQPHTSAGRVPTDKGYRFYVDNLKLGTHKSRIGRGLDADESDDSFSFFQDLTKKIACFTSDLALSYFPEEDIIFKEGWENIFKEPEFEDTDLASKFAEMVERMEKNIDALSSFDSTQIFIGRESPIPDSQEFSIVISRVHFANRKDGILALLGPKRMDYNKNVDIINSLNKNVRKKRTGKKGK